MSLYLRTGFCFHSPPRRGGVLAKGMLSFLSALTRKSSLEPALEVIARVQSGMFSRQLRFSSAQMPDRQVCIPCSQLSLKCLSAEVHVTNLQRPLRSTHITYGGCPQGHFLILWQSNCPINMHDQIWASTLQCKVTKCTPSPHASEFECKHEHGCKKEICTCRHPTACSICCCHAIGPNGARWFPIWFAAMALRDVQSSSQRQSGMQMSCVPPLARRSEPRRCMGTSRRISARYACTRCIRIFHLPNYLQSFPSCWSYRLQFRIVGVVSKQSVHDSAAQVC